MTIARRLLILLGVPLLILVGLGLVVRDQLHRIESRSRFVAETRIASLALVGNVTRSYTEMRVDVRRVLLTDDAAERARARAAFAEDRAQLERGLRQYADSLVADDQDRRLLSEFGASSRDWIGGAESVLSLAETGRHEEAIALLDGSLAESGRRLSSVSEEWIRHNETLATIAGRAAVATLEDSRRTFFLALGAAAALSLLLGLLTFRRITPPIRSLATSVKSIAAGDYSRTVPSTRAADEVGELARSIDVLKQGAAAAEEQRWVRSTAGQIGNALQGAASLAEFGKRLLSGLVPALGGGAAGFYVHESEPGRLRRLASYGLAGSDGAPETIGAGEGLVGQCARESEPVVLTDLPAGYLPISSGLGQAAPAQVAAWPLVSQGALLAVLEIASFRRFRPRERSLLEELLPVAAMSLAILQRNLGTQELLARSQEQQESLRASEVQFRTLLEAAPEAMILSDLDGRIQLVNAQAEKLFGYEKAEMVGQPVEMLVPERVRSIHPSHRRTYHDAPSVRSMGAALNLAAVRKDGSEFPV